MSTITINNDIMQTLVAKTFLDGLTAEQKEQVLLNAVSFLLKPQERNVHGRTIQDPAPFQDAFNSAAYRVARELADEMVKNDEKFKQGVRDVFTKAVEKMFEEGFANKMAEKIASQVQEGLKDARDW